MTLECLTHCIAVGESKGEKVFPNSLQGSTPISLISLHFPIVLVLHTPLMSRPSQIARKGEELCIEKTQTLTTKHKSFFFMLTRFFLISTTTDLNKLVTWSH